MPDPDIHRPKTTGKMKPPAAADKIWKKASAWMVKKF
jgi:hypothetical protein